jgi:nitrate reductase NapE component
MTSLGRESAGPSRTARASTTPDHAAIATGLAHREQRRVLFLALVLLPVQLAIAVVWVRTFLAGALPNVFGWFWVAVLAVLIGIVPFTLRRRHQVAGRAAAANERIARRPR